MLSEEGVADDGRWILMMRRTDMFGDWLLLGEFEDSTGLGLVAMLVRRRGVGRGGGLGCVARLMEGTKWDEGGIELEELGRMREGAAFVEEWDSLDTSLLHPQV